MHVFLWCCSHQVPLTGLNHFPAEENHALLQQSYRKRTSVLIIHNKESKIWILISLPADKGPTYCFQEIIIHACDNKAIQIPISWLLINFE